ncbi:hypothetical protein C4577_02370 [Candidatus Parcubacteria bacterium]|nr:MAG: hypothetical protein C4577_02370 [Candidatus Parcubacteria bacterium]
MAVIERSERPIRTGDDGFGNQDEGSVTSSEREREFSIVIDGRNYGGHKVDFPRSREIVRPDDVYHVPLETCLEGGSHHVICADGEVELLSVGNLGKIYRRDPDSVIRVAEEINPENIAKVNKIREGVGFVGGHCMAVFEMTPFYMGAGVKNGISTCVMFDPVGEDGRLTGVRIGFVGRDGKRMVFGEDFYPNLKLRKGFEGVLELKPIEDGFMVFGLKGSKEFDEC